MLGLLPTALSLLAARVWAIPPSSRNSRPEISHTLISIPSARIQHLAQLALNVTTDLLSNRSSKHPGSNCTLENLEVRRDWRVFSPQEKKDYIQSLLCLQNLPARTPSNLAAGAKTRYDDFLATHINQTIYIHRTGTFLAWHRYFIHEFLQALRSECGYTGSFPYWDWGADVDSMEKSEVFDGSDTSLSGNGVPIPDQLDIQLPPPYNVTLPPGTGGGCVTSGPFINYTVNMGPSLLSQPGGNITGLANPLDYNPRCLNRDLTTEILQRYANYIAILELITGNDNILDFETDVQGRPGSGSIGVHGAGHYAMGGDPGRDADASPGEPGFWHHHGMIDRVWWIWQSLDLEKRQNAIAGTGTYLNDPPSPNITMDTVINIGHANGGPISMGQIMSTVSGPFCYVYV